MENKIVFVICLMAISSHMTSAERSAGGYFYQQPQIGGGHSQTRPYHEPTSQHFLQQLQPPPQQQSQFSSNYENGQQNLPNFHQNPINFALPHHHHHHQQQQQPFNPLPLDFQLPIVPQLNNINYSPPQLFNPYPENNVMRAQFEIENDNQGNSIEQGCNPEPIVGRFKPELVDLANGGPLTRVITTCGPNSDCKTIALKSDLNRVQAVLPRLAQNSYKNPQQGGQFQPYGARIEGRSFVNSDVSNSLVRPPNRRLFAYSEILKDDIYN